MYTTHHRPSSHLSNALLGSRSAAEMTNSTMRLNNSSQLSDATTNSASFTHGLAGVDQLANYLFINLLVIFFFIICAVSLVLRLSSMGHHHVRHLFAAGPGRDGQSYWTQNRTWLWPWVKRHVLYAPVWKKRHNREIQLSSAVSIGTLPSRYHTVLLVVYVLSNIVYCFVLDWRQTNRAAAIAELRGRSGALAAINLIPTVLFALRNNPLIPLLQVSYDTFNLLHRWTARIVVVESVIHVIAWAINSLNAGGFHGLQNSLSHSTSYQWGMVATAVFVYMTIQAWAPVRHAFYETFLNVHRLLAAFALIGVYVHLDTAHLPQLPYMKLALAFWVLEWIARSTRIIYYNFSRQRQTRVTIEALPSETCRITFDLARPWKFRPGCHVHAYLPTIGLWSSHPFSVAWSEDHPISGHDDGKEKLPITALDLDLDHRDEVRTSLSLVVRARTGMTRKLFLAASSSLNGTITTYGCIEGPYGGHTSLDSYGTILLFAGGVGITHQVGYLRHLVAGCESGTVAARKIVLVWSVPNTEALEWVRPWMDEILKMKGRRDVLRIMLFVTKPKSSREVISGTGTVQMFPGRCDPQMIVDKEVRERVGAMVTTVCGPGAFADSVRHAVRRRIEVGSVDFVEEAFTY